MKLLSLVAITALGTALAITSILKISPHEKPLADSHPQNLELASALDDIVAEMRESNRNITQLQQQMAQIEDHLQNTGNTEGIENSAATGRLSGLEHANTQNEISPIKVPEYLGEAGPNKVMVVNPTPQQNELYEALKQRLNDPSFTGNLTLAQLNNLPELQSLPGPMRFMIIGKAIEKYNRGEIVSPNFLSVDNP